MYHVLVIVRLGFLYIYEWGLFCVNSSDVGSCLCFDRDTGLFMDASWFGSGAYCYSNQQTGWACDLAGELLDNSGLVWDYLTGNGGISVF